MAYTSTEFVDDVHTFLYKFVHNVKHLNLQAVDAARAGHNVVVSTSTASGKSLCYLLPVLEALAADRRATALFMFPTKALAQVTKF